jgi:hypothetical protein
VTHLDVRQAGSVVQINHGQVVAAGVGHEQGRSALELRVDGHVDRPVRDVQEHAVAPDMQLVFQIQHRDHWKNRGVEQQGNVV